jgi:hypothetical protein
MYVEFTLSEKLEHWLACHQNAFACFQGVSQSVMVDNCKVAVLDHPLGGPPTFNPHYLDFARHYGFQIRACGPRQAHEKGRVENAVAYVKKNFLAGLDLVNLATLNAGARHWLDTVANVRVHGETHRQPCALFAEEKSRLLPLHPHPYPASRILDLRASSQFRITVDTNHYSGPARYARHHARQILALSEVYGVAPVQRALDDAIHYQAFSAQYIANLLQQRQRPLPEPGALHLTRSSDLLELDLPAPDLSLYQPKEGGAA